MAAPSGLNEIVRLTTMATRTAAVTARPQRDPVNSSAGISGIANHLKRVVIRYTMPRHKNPAARLGLWDNPVPPLLLTSTPPAADQLVGPE